MKKVLLILIAFATLVLASCRGHKTCPTYNSSKTPGTEKLQAW